MQRRKVLVEGKRQIYPYVYLYEAADFLIEQAEKSQEGSFYNCMSAIICSAFCIEAYLNHAGSILLPYWDDKIKRDLSTESKLKIVCHHLGLEADLGKPPFQSFTALFKFRTAVAHATTETLTDRRVQKVVKFSKVEYPKAWWEKQCTLKTAERLLADTKSMIETISKAANLGEYPLGTFSVASGSGTILS